MFKTMDMLSFACDYLEGAHPLILKKLSETNLTQEPGYGFDSHCEKAKSLIREACGRPGADVFFLVGGTQTNATVIDSLLRGYEGVVAAQTGHIAVHESGAIEFGGHKVLTLPGHGGKIHADELKTLLETFNGDFSKDHMVFPGMVYISFPTEYGTVYSRNELEDIHAVCREYAIPLFIDGARLGYGLTSPACDISLKDLAGLCEVFYIGGTKVGALCGEAVVFPSGNAPAHFFTTVKQHGALLAKGRVLGIQFETLFTDNLYFEIASSAVSLAMELRKAFEDKGIPMYIDSPTNQQFPILTERQVKALEDKVVFEIWEKLPDGRTVTRFATSWATTKEQISSLESLL